MTTTTRYVSVDGSLVAEPGEYDIVSTVVRVTGTSKSNGFTVSNQDATIIHTVALRAADEPAVEANWQARAEKAEKTIADLVETFTAVFHPDFGGVDWRGDEAVQGFARDFIRIVHNNATTPVAVTGGTR